MAGRLRGRALHPPLIGHTGAVLWGAWGHLGDIPILATGGQDRTVRLWNRTTGQPHGEPLTGHTRSVSWGAWGHLGDIPILATGGQDRTVRLWNPLTRQPHGEPLTGHTRPVRWGAWGHLDNTPILATGDDDGTVRLWNPATAQPHGQPLTGHTGFVWWAAWGHLDNTPILATGGRDGTLRLWDPSTAQPHGQPLTGHTSSVLWGAWGHLDNTPILATSGFDRTVRLWNPATAQPHGQPLTGHTDFVLWGAWGHLDNTPILATGGADGTIRLWEVVEDRPLARLPSYQSDAVGLTDELGRDADAVAVAELICARSARPPLAVGLFGEWGEGKSHFLKLVQQQVTATARPDNPLAHSAVRQVQFNAWHYAETELWPSLVAEMFTQLAAPIDTADGAEEHRRSRLEAEKVAERALRQELEAARHRRDRLRRSLKRPDERWQELPADQRQQLRVLAGDRAERIFKKAVRTTAALHETRRHAYELMRRFPLRAIAGMLGLVVLLAGGAWALTRALPALWRLVAAALPSVAVLVGAFRLVAAVRVRASEAWAKATRYGSRQADRLQAAADVADAEVATLERRLQNLTAAGELAGLVADRAGTGDYRGQLGVMTQIREDFQHMATLLAQAAAATKPDGATDDRPPGIDRIILYIDDLDRCPPARVVAVLEAIHLLLAVELFVVVVAVDPRWLLRAIAAHYRDVLDAAVPAASGAEDADPAYDLADPHDEELWRSTPAQYLEKIFQVVLTLPPLDTAGYQRLVNTLVGPREDRPDAAYVQPAPEAAAPVDRAPAPTGPAAARARRPARDDDMYGVRLPAARVIERVDPLTLEPDELKLLNLLGPPLLVRTPRTTKRFANSYGLLTALRRDHRTSDLQEHRATIKDADGREREVAYYPYRAGMVLLAALIAYPALGPDLFRSLRQHAADNQHHTWPDFLDGAPAPPADEKSSGPATGRQWDALIDGLRLVTRTAPEHDLPLPEPLTAWAAWLVPVGRLSFPTGRIATSLAAGEH